MLKLIAKKQHPLGIRNKLSEEMSIISRVSIQILYYYIRSNKKIEMMKVHSKSTNVLHAHLILTLLFCKTINYLIIRLNTSGYMFFPEIFEIL